MSTATRPMTVEEFFEFANRPENGDRWHELNEGKVVEYPLPRGVHGFVCANIGYHLGTYCYERNPIFRASMRCGIIVSRDPDTVLGPDLSLFHNTKSWDVLKMESGYGKDVPHLVVEVLSPEDRQERITRKVRQYLRGGVASVWVVDPAIRGAMIYRSGSDPVVLSLDDTIIDDELPGFSCLMIDFFRVHKSQRGN